MSEILRIPYTFFRPLYEKTSFHRSVIEELNDHGLRNAYSHCRAITRFYAKTFYMATRFLPNEKQRSIFAIYGLCRYIDNLVDEATDLVDLNSINTLEIAEKLQHFEHKLTSIYRGHKTDDPILKAFFDTATKYDIALELPLMLIEGVRMDLTKSRYADFEELYDYSYKVASVVGLMTSQVFDYEDKKALEYAVDLGIAMQLTNILRDIGEDLERDRIYLPKEDLDRFDISEEELFAKERSEKFVEMMKFQIQRAREYYERADLGITMLSEDSRLPVYLARYNYGRILDKIEENEYEVFSERAHLNGFEKFTILPKIFVKMKASA